MKARQAFAREFIPVRGSSASADARAVRDGIARFLFPQRDQILSTMVASAAPWTTLR